MKRCLVIDDSRPIRLVACRILAALSFDAEEAADGAAGLAACGRAMPDVILLDWRLPDLDSIGFLRTLRRRNGGAVPAVIFCTTENDVVRIAGAVDAGVDEYLMKPFDRGDIESVLAGMGLLGSADDGSPLGGDMTTKSRGDIDQNQ